MNGAECPKANRCARHGSPKWCHTDVFNGTVRCFKMKADYYEGFMKGRENNGKTVFRFVARSDSDNHSR